MSRSKKPTLSHRLEYLTYRAVEQFLRRLSLETTFRLGEFVGAVIYRLAPDHRRTVIRNLRYAFGREKSREAIEDLAARVFERTGANLFSSIRVPFSSDHEIEARVVFEGLEEVARVAGKQGIVAVSPHMGNWELLAQAAHLAIGSFKAGTHYRPLNNQLLNRLVERRRKKRGLRLFAKQTSGYTMASFVKGGGFLGILADQRVGNRGFPGIFFGRPTTCSLLPDLMARRGKGKLFSLVCETIGPARWKISFTPIPEISPQACAASLEKAWRNSPEDVFWFEDRWQLRGSNRLSFLEHYASDHDVTRPLRFVNLAPEKVAPPNFPASLITCENHPLRLDQPKACLRHELLRIMENGETPVDVFVLPAEDLERVAGLTGKTLAISGLRK